MMYDLQKASLLKRASAWLLDIILLVVLATGVGMVLSAVLQYDSHIQILEDCYAKYEQEFDIDFDEYSDLTEEEMDRYEAANAALQKDKDAQRAYSMVINLSLAVVSLSVLLSYLALEFLVPLLFGNGQTVGKKIFGIALVRLDGVKMSTLALFVRTVLGKYTVETMIPVLLVLMMLFGLIGIIAPTILLILLVSQVLSIILSKTNCAIHDHMAATVAVDMASQRIFESPEALLAYQKQVHAEKAQRSPY